MPRVGRAPSDLPSPAYLAELDGEARRTSDTEEGDKGFALSHYLIGRAPHEEILIRGINFRLPCIPISIFLP